MNCLRNGFRVGFLLGNLILIFSLFLILTLPECGVESALPFGIFPILPSEWYYKPTPGEQVVFGLILVKALTLRLLSIFGVLPIPYHLNDLFTLGRAFGKRSVKEDGSNWRNLTLPQSGFPIGIIPGLGPEGGHLPKVRRRNYEDDLFEMIRIFSGIRRMDMNNCFLKTLCMISNDVIKGKGKTLMNNKKILNSIRYLNWVEQLKLKNKMKPDAPVMELFMTALKTGEKAHSSCVAEYRKCSLASEKVLKYDSMIMSMF